MLPILDLPTYELKIPSTGQPIKVRPFTVREEKILLIAAESKDENEIINTTKQIVQNCIVSEGVDIEKLPFFDVDYLFIALRAKSVGETIEVKFTCNNVVNGNKCNNIFPSKIDISNVKLIKQEGAVNVVDLGGGVTVKMKYPNYTAMKAILEKKQNIEKEIHIIANSIEYIQKKEQYYTLKDITKDEIIKFIESLTREQYVKLSYFVNNFPTFVVTAEATCDKCGFHHKLDYRDYISFFV